MKLFAPAYYKDFKCIADKCKHNCCIGWEIDIDDDTLDLYADIKEPYGEVIRNSVDFDDIPHFRLTEDERCPHLDKSGLCKIITEFGEDHLCDICTDHPRFYEDTILGKVVGIGMSCEEACRLILTSERYNIVEIGEVEGEVIRPSHEDDPGMDEEEFDYLGDVEHIYEIMEEEKDLPFIAKTDIIVKAYALSSGFLSQNLWKKNLAKLEFLNEDNRKLFEKFNEEPKIPSELEKPIETIFAYFIYRHGSGVKSLEGYFSGIAFGFLCTFLIASIAEYKGIKDIDGLADIARTVSEEIEYSEENTEILKTFYDFSCALF